MPFVRLIANLTGQRAVGGLGQTVDLGAGLPGQPVNFEPSPKSDLVIVYRTQGDSRVRPSHAALEGRQWGIDDSDAPAPPLGYGCRCFIEILTKDEADKRPPATEAAALKKFPDLEQNVEKYMGKEIAQLYESGQLKPEDLLRETGDPIGVTEARVIAAARSAGRSTAKGLQALAELNGMGLEDRAIRAFATQAQKLIDDGATIEQALGQVIGNATRIGSLASRDPAVRAKRLAAAIARFKASGLIAG